MEIDRRNQLKLVGRDTRKPKTHGTPVDSLNSKRDPNCWADDVLSEIARVRALIGMVNGELARMFSDDSMHAVRVLEKNTELRELHAYYKGLRFAVDRQNETAVGRLSVTIQLD